MNEMIERVARRIADQLGLDFDTLYESKGEWTDDRGSRHDLSVPVKRDILDAARAAIEAMRDPTPKVSTAILIAASKVASIHDGEIYTRGDAGEFIMSAAIDAALKEPAA